MSKKSIEHWDAMKQDFAEHPDKAVAYVREFVRQANELEDRVQALEAENAELRNELKAALERC